MAQTVQLPIIKDCWCGAKAICLDWDYRMAYKVICDNNHTLTKECGTKNRAIHRWNNKVIECIAFDYPDDGFDYGEYDE